MRETRPPIAWKRPLILYLLTWGTTTFVGLTFGSIGAALTYSVSLMLILSCHELGHYFQTRRYCVPASLPHFIPIPMEPFGTFGAIIFMGGRIPNMRALFDIGISGPLAGLIPTLVCCYFGIKWSHVGPIPHNGTLVFGESLLFQWIIGLLHGPIPPGMDLMMHPLALSAWVGLFITSLNLMPFGQLDGGHLFYALVGPDAPRWARRLFWTAFALVVWYQLWTLLPMLLLIAFLGTTHPPTRNDKASLGVCRRLLGWATLAFVFIGFTPNPIRVDLEQAPIQYVAHEDTVEGLRDGTAIGNGTSGPSEDTGLSTDTPSLSSPRRLPLRDCRRLIYWGPFKSHEADRQLARGLSYTRACFLGE